MFIFALIERHFIGDKYENFWCAKLAGFLLGLGLIPILYYSYTGIFGTSLDWVNFVVLTYVQPEIPLFQDPRTGMYGVNNN